jgi:hypothetical protein
VKRPSIGDGWFESEEPTRLGMVTELQRVRRRMATHPIPVIVLALLLTAGVTYKIATKARVYEADVVLALTEGTMSTSKRSMPFGELKGYVSEVLLPDAKLIALAEKRNLHRLRKKFGAQYAVTELREQIAIAVWKNSFMYYDEGDSSSRKSARIGLTVTEGDPDLAYDLAHDIASIVIESHEERRRKIADDLAQEVKLMQGTMSDRLADVETAISVKQAAAVEATKAGKPGLASALQVDLSALASERKNLLAQLGAIAQMPELFGSESTRAGLDTTLSVVEERRPERQEANLFTLIIVAVVVGTGALIGSALFLGAFDARVHDTDDVSRLGLPVLGHLPGFPGDHVGSLGARGARRARVPSFKRWRSHR